ncbi:MAG: nucleoside triphosphate pyrophosphohydrolase [Kiritimatiellia bacterium]
MNEKKTPIEKLLDVMRKLRGPDGCPWDREQTVSSLKPCLLEECHELLEAMNGDDTALHIEELGDVLLQVVFQCIIREQEGTFTFDDVARAITAKLVRRHPHVFGDVNVNGSGDVLKNWEQIKQLEKKDKPEHSALDGVPATLPALLKAQRMQSKASRVGFDWKHAAGAIDKIYEEIDELIEALENKDAEETQKEVGDLLFSVVNYCRFIDVDAESALELTNRKFSSRFKAVEKKVRETGRDMRKCTLEELDSIWDEVKIRMRDEE